MKKCLSLMLALLFMLSCALAEGAGLPAYVDESGDPIRAAACAWLLEAQAGSYAPGDVAIPCPLILAVDDADPADTLVWGNFCLYWYELRGTTLFCVSGGEAPGLLHMKQDGDTFAVTAFDGVGDGDDYAEGVQRIFGMRDGLLAAFEDSAEAQSAAELQAVSDYVNWNGLNVTQTQAFGWPPVGLVNAPETPEADQIVRYESPLGYSLDYDLRKFSQITYDEESDGFAGVGELEGISLDVQRCDLSVAEALADWERDQAMARPAESEVVIGAEGIPATLVRDAALAADEVADTYLVALDGGCLRITLSNTWYAAQDAPVIPGAGEALAQLLATLRVAG